MRDESQGRADVYSWGRCKQREPVTANQTGRLQSIHARHVHIHQHHIEAVKAFVVGRFGVVLMDVHMPGVDGLQATRLIRQHERDRQLAPTPIIALTASVMCEDRHAARQAGMDGFAVKPLELRGLFNEIARVLHCSPQLSSRDTVDTSQVATKSVVDWRHGTALWGSEARLSAALRQFLDGWRDQYPLPTGAEADPDWAAARFSLHGLCGAAGNLALPGYNSTGPWRTPLL